VRNNDDGNVFESEKSVRSDLFRAIIVRYIAPVILKECECFKSISFIRGVVVGD